jgi:hypothetical protein
MADRRRLPPQQIKNLEGWMNQQAISGSAGGDAAKNPVTFFEHHARSIWNSELGPDEKALRLYSVGDSITKYLRKSEIELASRVRDGDEWHKLATQRAKAYLDQLATDVRRLAVSCQRESAIHKA